MFGDNDNQSQDGTGSSTSAVGLTHSSGVFPPPAAPPPPPPSDPIGPPVTSTAMPATPDEPVNKMTLDDLAAAVQGNEAIPHTPAPAGPVPSISGPSSDLLDIKQQALQNLTPLVSKLDQTPLEKFKTTMMMIQASDNQSLIQTAYDAAQQITDEKEKAQALLDIVNEINYFTQHQEQ